MVVFTGCMMDQKLITCPLSEGGVRVADNIIYCGGKPFAELRYFDTRMAKTLAEAKGIISELVIYYYNIDKEVWIHPKKGLSIYRDGEKYSSIEDMKRVWGAFKQEHDAYMRKEGKFPKKWATIYLGGSPWHKEDAIRGVYADSVRISPDGKYVYYKTQGVLWNSSHKYQVEYGVSK